MHVIVSPQDSVGIGRDIDQPGRQDPFAKWKGPDAFVLPIFRRGQKRFRKNHRLVLSPAALDFLQDRIRHGGIAPTKDGVERNDLRTEIERLADNVRRILVLEFQRWRFP